MLFCLSVIFTPLILNGLPLAVGIAKHKALISVALDSVLLFVLLAVAVPYAGHAGSLFSVAVPIMLFSLSWTWIIMLVLRYLPINGLFKASICTFVSGAYVLLCNSVIYAILDHKALALPLWNFLEWSDKFLNGNVTVLTAAVFNLVALFLFIGGKVLQIKLNAKNRP